ncbi:MAG: hypothetical protein AAGH68_12840 [Pseudomonadota bacterium]
MTMIPEALCGRDLDAVPEGSLRVDPSEYEDYAINRGLISADFEGSVTVRTPHQFGSEVDRDLQATD